MTQAGANISAAFFILDLKEMIGHVFDFFGRSYQEDFVTGARK